MFVRNPRYYYVGVTVQFMDRELVFSDIKFIKSDTATGRNLESYLRFKKLKTYI